MARLAGVVFKNAVKLTVPKTFYFQVFDSALLITVTGLLLEMLKTFKYLNGFANLYITDLWLKYPLHFKISYQWCQMLRIKNLFF